MSAISQLLERMRTLRLPPGAAAGVIAVPSAGDELAREVGFLFKRLDAIEQRSQTAIERARAEAARIDAAADAERRRLLADAQSEAGRQAAELLEQRRTGVEQARRSMLEVAERDAERIVRRGRDRTPAFVDEVVQHLLEGPR